MKCKTKDCKLSAEPSTLNYKLRTRDKKTFEPLDYTQTIKWVCTDGHVHLSTKLVSAALLAYEPQEKESSANRFKHKGFRGHRIRPAAKPESGFNFPPEMSNRERNAWRRDRRWQIKQQEVQQNAAAN